jgi:hypothetical protein
MLVHLGVVICHLPPVHAAWGLHCRRGSLPYWQTSPSGEQAAALAGQGPGGVVLSCCGALSVAAVSLLAVMCQRTTNWNH